jgi:hypothetical protein
MFVMPNDWLIKAHKKLHKISFTNKNEFSVKSKVFFTDKTKFSLKSKFFFTEKNLKLTDGKFFKN